MCFFLISKLVLECCFLWWSKLTHTTLSLKSVDLDLVIVYTRKWRLTGGIWVQCFRLVDWFVSWLVFPHKTLLVFGANYFCIFRWLTWNFKYDITMKVRCARQLFHAYWFLCSWVMFPVYAYLMHTCYKMCGGNYFLISQAFELKL